MRGKNTRPIQYCVEHRKGLCRVENGVIGTDPNHYCPVYNEPIHSVCGSPPSETVRAAYAPGSPEEGSGTPVMCSNCIRRGEIRERPTMSGIHSRKTEQFLIVAELIPESVNTFQYTESKDGPVQKTFNDSIHYVCESGANPFLDVVQCDRDQIILPGFRQKAFSSDNNLKVARKPRVAGKSRRYRQRHREKYNRTARARYHEKKMQASTASSKHSRRGEDGFDSNSFFLPTVPEAGQFAVFDVVQAHYHVHNVTDVYTVNRTFHGFKPYPDKRMSGVCLGVEHDQRGERVIRSLFSARLEK
ncbi:hypothetical protein FGB62_9g013 [Gracilaria domingensis]|nr:hypothetical protein FGB62_9g013 [Gracilaria domingensis]